MNDRLILTDEEKREFPSLEKTITYSFDDDTYPMNIPTTDKSRYTPHEYIEKFHDIFNNNENSMINKLENYKDFVEEYRDNLGGGYIHTVEQNKYTYAKRLGGHPKAHALLALTADLIGFTKKRDPSLFTTREHLELLNRILYCVITLFGLFTLESPMIYLKPFAARINRYLGETRILLNCGHTINIETIEENSKNKNNVGYDKFFKINTRTYPCGRAVEHIPCENNPSNPGYILIYKTKGIHDDEQDFTILEENWQRVNQELCPARPASGGKRKKHKTRKHNIRKMKRKQTRTSRR